MCRNYYKRAQIYKILNNEDSILLRITNALPHGSRAEIAVLLGVSKSLVMKVLKGKRRNDEVLRAAENKFLVAGLDCLPFAEFQEIALLIFERRGAQNPQAAFMKEVVLPQFKPTQFNFSNLPLN